MNATNQTKGDNMLPETLYPIGYTYKRRRSKDRTDTCTVVDYLYTYNSKHEIVSFRYVAEHEFLGQKVLDRDVVHTTILRSSQ